MKFKPFIVMLAFGFLCATDAKHDPVTILGVGDSLTQRADSYLPALGDMLRNDGYNIELVGPHIGQSRFGEFRQAGFSGKNAEYVAARLKEIYSAYPADMVLLQNGHNHSSETQPVKGIIEAYKKMINTVLEINPKATIFVAQIVESGKLPKYAYIPELNKAIRTLVREIDDERVVYVPVARGFDWQLHTVEDHVHPNIEGGVVMAKNWRRSIVKYMKKYI